jgi:molybdopterin molybdotransferase
MLTAACWADGLAVIECEQQVLKHDNVMFLSFSDLMH